MVGYPYPNRYPSHRIDVIIPFMKFIHLMISGSGMFIPDPGSEFFPSRIKEFKHFNPKKWFLSSRKYDPGCSSLIWIPDPDPDFLTIPDPGFRGQKGTGSRIRNTAHDH